MAQQMRLAGESKKPIPRKSVHELRVDRVADAGEGARRLWLTIKDGALASDRL